MKLTKIKIGETEYPIKYVDKIDERTHQLNNLHFKKTETLGLCYPRQGFWEDGKIIIKIDDDAERTTDTLFHEITHAMFAEMAMHYPEYQKKLDQLYKDEFFIQKFSELLRDVVDSMKRDKKWGGKRKQKYMKGKG